MRLRAALTMLGFVSSLYGPQDQNQHSMVVKALESWKCVIYLASACSLALVAFVVARVIVYL